MKSVVAYVGRNHIALLALFIALGGTSYAALSLPANSVGTRQIKKHAVTASKLEPGLAGLLRGPRGKTGAKGAAGPAGANGKDGANGTNGANGTDGANGRDGVNGKDFSVSSVLPSGQTETGDWALSASTGQIGVAVVNFLPKLPARIDFSHVVYLDNVTDANCPAFGQAKPGYLCFYARDRGNFSNPQFQDGTGANGASVDAVVLTMTATGPPSLRTIGTWAVTAP